jgi:hypothetical protein
MSIIKESYRVMSYRSRTSFEGYQILLKEWSIFGLKVWSSEIDREDVPSWVYIQQATLGSTDWKSKFSEYIK